jgi:hypothetical protein
MVGGYSDFHSNKTLPAVNYPINALLLLDLPLLY